MSWWKAQKGGGDCCQSGICSFGDPISSVMGKLRIWKEKNYKDDPERSHFLSYFEGGLYRQEVFSPSCFACVSRRCVMRFFHMSADFQDMTHASLVMRLGVNLGECRHLPLEVGGGGSPPLKDYSAKRLHLISLLQWLFAK